MLARVPIRVRLTLAFTLAMAAVLAAMFAFVFVRVDHALTGSVDRALRVQADELGQHANVGGPLFDPDTSGASSLAQLIGPNGALLASSRRSVPALLHHSDIRQVLAGTTIHRDTKLPELDHEWRLLAFPVHADGQSVVGLVASSLESRDETRDHLAGELLIVGPLGLLLAGIGGYVLAAAALRPVEEMRRRATAISGSTLGERLPVPAARDEISQLATTLNATFDRLDAALERERRFVADASHELRTPLALMRTELELALRRERPPEELLAALRSAAEETERLTALAEDLLLIARSDAGELPERRAHVAIAHVIERVVGRYERKAAEPGRELEVSCEDGLEATADPLQLERALANLVENALLHGAGRVRIHARADGDSVRLSVTDEGKGMPELFLPRAFERFSRADEARGRGGTGLGLAIVELIARSHGGTTGAENRPGSGLSVWFTVPRARPAATA
jgi:signal transduction histidine kinase